MAKRTNQAGFTIVELLIATAVFSVVLLVMAAAIIQIGRLYYKGITSAHTQEVARSVMETMSQTIQFTSGQITTSGLENPNDFQTQAICIGIYHYSYKLGQQRTGDQHALVMYNNFNSCAGKAAQTLNDPLQGQSQELLGENMRLSKFSVQKDASGDNAYAISVGVIYGDDDLLCVADDTSGLGQDCNNETSMTATQINAAAEAGKQLRCKNLRASTQFCAVSELSTIVERRVQ
jgi:prepilin-type N-terminal cleavage/methylation domain-containing protein